LDKTLLVNCHSQFVAKKLDKRLMDLGGTAIVERGLGDDQHPSGYGYMLGCQLDNFTWHSSNIHIYSCKV